MAREKAKIPGGYYIIARKMNESDIATAPPCTREVWRLFLSQAGYEEWEKKGTTLKKGQLLAKYETIREDLKWYEGARLMHYPVYKIETAIKYLKRNEMITTEKTTRGIIITLCNYDLYHDLANYENPKELVNHATPGTAMEAATGTSAETVTETATETGNHADVLPTETAKDEDYVPTETAAETGTETSTETATEALRKPHYREEVQAFKETNSTSSPKTGSGLFVNDQPKKDSVSTKAPKEYSQAFVLFYRTFPRHEAPDDAWKAWQQKNPPLQECLDAIDKQKKYKAHLNSTGKFCPDWPLPATWIRAGRWKDEVPEIPTATEARNSGLRFAGDKKGDKA